VCVCTRARAYVYVFIVELTPVLLLLMLHYARKDLVCAGRKEFHLRWTGAIPSASMHSWVVSDTPKALYLTGTGSRLPWRKIVVA
jgi:hypothetical protein